MYRIIIFMILCLFQTVCSSKPEPKACPTCNPFTSKCLVAASTGCDKNDCCDPVLYCKLTNTSQPKLGGKCDCRFDCQSENQGCNQFAIDCTRRGCCTGLTCISIDMNIADIGGKCLQCPKCQPLNKKCRVNNGTCQSLGCCSGLKCKMAGNTDLGGICVPV